MFLARFKHLTTSNILYCRYGQFDYAKETFEVIGDNESLLDLFICHLNPSAMRRLAQKLEEESGDPELRRYCERILRVRSTGWTQGIFANFAAESMVPKGPEWGGGNWDIKTPTDMKSIPQWELAGEVMPYMKSDDGTIPSIVADHIGVYLGCVKGRVNVVEIKEDTLVSKPGGLLSSLGKPVSDKPLALPAGESSSLMGLESLGKQNVADEQAKAAEEFKKTMYGAAGDGSSSDEEGVPKTKKLQIRIRDKPASSTVDVNKLKEATRTFKLGDGLGLPMSRTKSISAGSQDLGEMLSQPSPSTTAPVSASAPVDPFAMSSWTQQPQPVTQPAPSGTGMVAGPIPEDFFQNTIPSVEVAKTLLPAGTYLSKMDQIAQAAKNAPNQANDTTQPDIGLPGGGVPPTAQQPGVPYQTVGLPDGGVPPQFPGQTQGTPQFPGQTQGTPQAPVYSQPLDLSVLGVPNTDSGKPPGQPTSPTSVRPGQVNLLCIFYVA